MKKAGNVSDFTRERDEDLMRSFKEVLRDSRGLSLPQILEEATQRPTKKFWVSEGRAAIVIGAMRRGMTIDNMIPERQEMYREIYRRVCREMDANPDLCLTHAVRQVIEQPAPKFYLSRKSAKTIIYRIRRNNRRRAEAARLLKQLYS